VLNLYGFPGFLFATSRRIVGTAVRPITERRVDS
jgi:hypothetical protein